MDERRGTSLLERVQELAAVDAALEGAAAGIGRLVVFEGPAGIGKSSLLAAARERARAAGMRVLQARAGELESALSFGVVRQLFEPELARADAGERERLLAGAAVHAASLFDPHAAADRASSDDDTSLRLLHGLFWLAANAAEHPPLVLVVDDLQWADAASLRWLSYVVRRIDNVRIAAFAAVRPLDGEIPDLAELLVGPSTEVVRPGRLSPAAVTELVRAELPEPVDAAFAAACHRAAGGNPLLVRELLRSLVAEGVAPTVGSVEAVERAAPDAVARSVRLRLSRLPAEAAAVARAAAALGEGATDLHVAHLAGLSLRALSDAMWALARVHLFEDTSPPRFVHPLLRNAVYESMPPSARAEHHARAAAMLRSAGVESEVVAAQILNAPPGSVEGATAMLRKAAHRAAAEGAYDSAAAYLTRALQEPLGSSERAEILVALAENESRLARPAALEHLNDALGLLEDRAARVSVRRELARTLFLWSREDDAVRAFEDAIAEHGSRDDEVGRELEAERLAIAIRKPELHAAAHRRLDSVADDAAESPAGRQLLGLRAYVDAARGINRERARADAARLYDALSSTSEGSGSVAYGPGFYVFLFADELDVAARFVERVVEEARRRGEAVKFANAVAMRAIIGYARGTLIDAEADARLALEAVPELNVLFAPHVHAYLAHVLVERDSVDEASELLDRLEARVGSEPEQFGYVPHYRARAAVAAERGDHRAALELALTTGRALAAVGIVNPAVSHPSWRLQAAVAHHALGAESEALELARQDASLAAEWGAPRALGRALRIFGAIEGGAEGLARIREAVRVLEASAARLEYAYALTDLGAALRRSNQRSAAREPLRQALQVAERAGATALARRAHEELLASGGRPRRRSTIGVDALTPTERRIAAIAATGLSNREIAQAQFLALRTVEMHLTNAFRKLGVSSRTQLHAALAVE